MLSALKNSVDGGDNKRYYGKMIFEADKFFDGEQWWAVGTVEDSTTEPDQDADREPEVSTFSADYRDIWGLLSGIKVRRISPSNMLAYREIKEGRTHWNTPESWFLRYKMGVRNYEQSRAMIAGSAFDALVKGAIGRIYLGIDIGDELLEKQCDHSIDWARETGMTLLRFYVRCGAMARLRKWIDGADEIVIDGQYSGEVTLPDGSKVELGGLPDLDLRFGNVWHTHDWKVSGYMSSASPKPGYSWSSKTDDSYKSGLVRTFDVPVSDAKLNGSAPQEMTVGTLSAPQEMTIGTLSDPDHSSGMIKFPNNGLSADWDLQTTVYSHLNGSGYVGQPRTIHQIVKSKSGVLQCCEYGAVGKPGDDAWILNLAREIRNHLDSPDTPEEARWRSLYSDRTAQAVFS